MPSGVCETRRQHMAAWSDRNKSKVSIFALVAALIASVTFAATFTMPGGYKNDGPNQGSAVLVKHVAFKAFLLSNTIALCCSIPVVVGFIWVWSEHKRFMRSVLAQGYCLTIIASLAMMVSFVSAVFAVVAPECMWLAIVILAIGVATPFFLVSSFYQLFFISYKALIGYKRSVAHNKKPV